MSINSAMLAGASGLRANASALAAISDNISNVNTTGYKRLRNDFTALLNQNANYSLHNSGGVTSTAQTLLSEQGALESSSVATHMAITGDGFFVTRSQGPDANTSEPFLYTRAGQFSSDTQGYLRNTAGYYLHGWPLDDTGVVTASPTDLNALEPIRVTGIGGAAEATSRVSMSTNLQASQAVSAGAATYNAAASGTNMASGAVTPDFQSSVQVYDSLGGLRTVMFSYLKSATPNTWDVEVHVQPASEVNNAGTAFVDGQIATGQVVFTQFGQLDTVASTLPTTLNIGSSTAATGPAWAAGLGAAAQTIDLDIGGTGSAGGLTQFDTPSSLTTSQVNGVSFGSLAAVEVDDQGFVTAQFSNGLSKKIYQVPIATFANIDGLVGQSGGVYRSSPQAGPLNMKGSGQAGAGEIRPQTVEASRGNLLALLVNHSQSYY